MPRDRGREILELDGGMSDSLDEICVDYSAEQPAPFTEFLGPIAGHESTAKLAL